jgi:hypothetical protein
MIRLMALMAAVLLSFMVFWAGAAQAASEAENAALTNVYEKYAAGFRAGSVDRVWEVIDPQCVFIDESGRRESGEAMLSKSREFFSSIRNASVTYTINDVQSKNGKLMVFIDTEARFDLQTKLLFIENWSSKILYNQGVDTWQKKGGAWKLVESKTLRPEELRDANGAAPGGGRKLVKFLQQGVCAKKCADTLIGCATGANEGNAAASAQCVAQNVSCIRSCKD